MILFYQMFPWWAKETPFLEKRHNIWVLDLANPRSVLALLAINLNV